ncbi:MAG: VCBS repeat-containing protein, partial [Gammaproteobacteria bacterium]
MSATIIGRVVHIKGAVEVRDLQGVIKLLSLGDDVHEGDLVQTGANSELIIDFLNGKRLELAETSEALLDESVHRGQEFGNSELFADIEAVQKALLEGTLDINDLPATAAGPEQGGIELGDGFSEAIVHTREAREGSVDVRLRDIEFDAEAGAGLIDLNPNPGPESSFPSAPEPVATPPSPTVFAIADAGALSEDAAVLTLNANVLGNDALASSSPLSVVAVNGSTAAVGSVVFGAFGTFTIAADGSYTYALDNAHASVQALASGENLTDTISYSAQNSSGSTDTASITITIHGSEDAPTITGTSSGNIGEDAIVNISGSLVANDVDAIDTPTIIAQPGTVGSYGTFTVNSAGVWTYTVDNAAAQSLGATDNVTETFTVTASTADGETTTMTITVNVAGSDDLPIISTDSGVVTEGVAPSATGTLTATDADNPTLEFVADTIAGAYGDLVVQTDGSWTYVLNSNAEALISGQVENEVLTITLTDGSTTTVAIAATGTDDVPVAQVHADSAVEDGAIVAGNVPAATDLDGDVDANGYALVTSVGEGSLTFNADGSYTFNVGGAF